MTRRDTALGCLRVRPPHPTTGGVACRIGFRKMHEGEVAGLGAHGGNEIQGEFRGRLSVHEDVNLAAAVVGARGVQGSVLGVVRDLKNLTWPP